MAGSGLERRFAWFIERRRIREDLCLLFLFRWMMSGWMLDERGEREGRGRWVTRLCL